MTLIVQLRVDTENLDEIGRAVAAGLDLKDRFVGKLVSH